MRHKPKSSSPIPIAETIAIHEALKAVITSVTPHDQATPGSCYYNEGHSDATVADALGLDVHKVTRVRSLVFGLLVPRSREEATSLPHLHKVLADLVRVLYDEDLISSDQHRHFVHQLSLPAE